MKKVISLSMAAVMTVSMAGCGNNQTTQESTVSESAATTAETEAETTAAETSPLKKAAAKRFPGIWQRKSSLISVIRNFLTMK